MLPGDNVVRFLVNFLQAFFIDLIFKIIKETIINMKNTQPGKKSIDGR